MWNNSCGAVDAVSLLSVSGSRTRLSCSTQSGQQAGGEVDTQVPLVFTVHAKKTQTCKMTGMSVLLVMSQPLSVYVLTIVCWPIANCYEYT